MSIAERPPAATGVTSSIDPSWSAPVSHAIDQPFGDTAMRPDDAEQIGEFDDRGRARWERPALFTVLIATAGLYLWGLGASGWANSFYSAAAQAGSRSWTAWFFGSSDAANSITVDKPPASLWIMGLSVRWFGLSSWSLLVPQALMGVGTVAVVHRTVRRWFSPQAAILAAIVMATTPVAALMFRFNNPDALLVLLMALAAHAVMRGVDDGRRRWMVWAGVAIGFGFLTKQLQVLLVVPPLALAYLVAAPHALRRRVADLLIGGGAMIAAAGWWLAIVTLIPASMRPYIGGSQNNSILELTLGYNGFGRLTGDETGSVGGGGNGGGGMWGQTGITRMFDGVMGGQISWLLPAALAFILVGLWVTRHTVRTDRTRAAVIVWGGWLVVTALVFSFMQGIFHEYYTVALAPAIAVMIGIGADVLWKRRRHMSARVVLAAATMLTVLWSTQLLDRAPTFATWLQPTVLLVGVMASLLLLAGPRSAGSGTFDSKDATQTPGAGTPRTGARLAAAGAALAVVACLAGPTAWAVDTAATAHTGAIVTAGPAVAGTGFGPPGGGFPRGGFPPGGNFPGNGGTPPVFGGTPPVFGGTPPVFGGTPPANDGTPPVFGGNGGPMGGGPIGGNGGPMGGGAAGGLLDSAAPSDEVVAALLDGADEYTWVAAAVGSNRAAGFQLASEQPVMAIGGFNGSDPSPTLEQFQQYVADGQIHWFISGGGFGQSPGGSDEATSIASWVASEFTATTIDGVTLYDLSAGTA
jgi:4-amino-4-deoxy-L-arabinose transferase-like glycosyltransferase